MQVIFNKILPMTVLIKSSCRHTVRWRGTKCRSGHFLCAYIAGTCRALMRWCQFQWNDSYDSSNWHFLFDLLTSSLFFLLPYTGEWEHASCVYKAVRVYTTYSRTWFIEQHFNTGLVFTSVICWEWQGGINCPSLVQGISDQHLHILSTGDNVAISWCLLLSQLSKCLNRVTALPHLCKSGHLWVKWKPSQNQIHTP